MCAPLIRLGCLLSLLIPALASAVAMHWTPIGGLGNACDPQADVGAGAGCYGGVSYAYNMGTYEVTTAQYAEFLNAKAAADPLDLYNTSMASGLSRITRTGVSGSYVYTASGGDTRAVNHVSFYDALRFANWMHNGQGSGDTETGSYTLLGGTPTPSNGTSVTRNADAIFAVPNENEWYKAAYYDASSASYFDYPAGSNTATTCLSATALPNHASCRREPPNEGQTPWPGIGSYAGSASPFGTFDQGGSVNEWNEISGIGLAGPACDANPEACRGIRGGGHQNPSIVLAAFFRDHTAATSSDVNIGFRLVMIPEPGTGLLVIAGLLGLAGRRQVAA